MEIFSDFYKNDIGWSDCIRSLLKVGLRKNKEHLELGGTDKCYN